MEQSPIVFWIHISLLTTEIEHISKDRLSMWLFPFTMCAYSPIFYIDLSHFY